MQGLFATIYAMLIKLRQKDTGPAYDADEDSNEAISMKVDTVDGKVDTVDGKVDTIDGIVDSIVAVVPASGIIQSAAFVKGVGVELIFPIYDKDGDLVVSATGLDSEVSKDGGAFSDCTNEASQIATNSGMYKLTLTATEMNADRVAVITKTTSADAKTTATVIYTSAAGA